MKNIFNFLLKKYSTNEKNRIEIIRRIGENVSNNYSEQTLYGNVYNYFIKFVMANPFIIKCTVKKDRQSLEMLKQGIIASFDKAINYIENETN